MTDYRSLAYAAGHLWVVLFVADLSLGIALERAGVYPGAMEVAVALGGVLCVLVGATGLVLVLLGRGGRGRQSELGEWHLEERRP